MEFTGGFLGGRALFSPLSSSLFLLVLTQDISCRKAIACKGHRGIGVNRGIGV